MNTQMILVPVDFSTGQTRALNLASSLARDTGGTLVIVHVEEPALAYSTDGAYYGAANPQHDDLVKMLHEVVPSASDVEYEYRILSGLPADAIENAPRQSTRSLSLWGLTVGLASLGC